MGIAADYRFVIAGIDGVEVDEVPASNPTWSYILNDAGSCSFVLPFRHPKALRSLFKIGQSELHIYRGTTRIWGGHFTSAQTTSEEDVRFGFDGFFARVKRRYVDTTQNFNAVEQFDIAWNLINFTQSKTNGNTGMNWTRAGVAASGITRTRNYPFWERANIGEILMDMSAINNGFDFDVSPTKVWTVYYPSKGAVQTVPFELGKNIQTLSLGEDATDTANTFSAIGAGDGKNTCIAVATSGANQTTYGLLEASESFTNIKHYATLQDKATERVRMLKSPRLSPNVTIWDTGDPAPYQYVVGDKVTIRAKDGYFDLDQQFRIISVVFNLSNEGREAISFQFDEETSP